MEERQRQEQIEMLIRFYNMQAGTSFRVGKPENRSAVNSAIERANGDIVKVKNAVREWVNNHNDDMQSGGAVIVCFDTILCEKKEEPKPEPEPEEKTEEKHGYILQIFYDKLADALIEAGIGDVSEYKEKLKLHRVFVRKDGGDIKVLYGNNEVDEIVKERNEYKHRAEVAERALKIADKLGELCGKKQDYIQQAEMELAEESKGD